MRSEPELPISGRGSVGQIPDRLTIVSYAAGETLTDREPGVSSPGVVGEGC